LALDRRKPEARQKYDWIRACIKLLFLELYITNKMTQIITPIFIKEFIKNNKIPFLATQPKLCIPIIIRLCQKMTNGIKFEEIKICDNLIIDGHHRYLSSLIVDIEIGRILSQKTSATQSIEWTSIRFDENDWDTPSKISHLNEQDAKYNQMDVEFINRITLG
jgi:hypothetical protein